MGSNITPDSLSNLSPQHARNYQTTQQRIRRTFIIFYYQIIDFPIHTIPTITMFTSTFKTQRYGGLMLFGALCLATVCYGAQGGPSRHKVAMAVRAGKMQVNEKALIAGMSIDQLKSWLKKPRNQPGSRNYNHGNATHAMETLQQKRIAKAKKDVHVIKGHTKTQVTCTKCNGSRKIPGRVYGTRDCTKCDATGFVQTNRRRLPARITVYNKRRRLCEHTSWLGMSFFGGTCKKCKRNAEITKLAAAHGKRTNHVTYPKTEDEHNVRLQKRLNKE